MEIDTDKIHDAVLTLFWLTLHNERCAWKGFDWDVTDRLHGKALIADGSVVSQADPAIAEEDREPSQRFSI